MPTVSSCLADLYMARIVPLHGVPLRIISDRGPDHGRVRRPPGPAPAIAKELCYFINAERIEKRNSCAENNWSSCLYNVFR